MAPVRPPPAVARVALADAALGLLGPALAALILLAAQDANRGWEAAGRPGHSPGLAFLPTVLVGLAMVPCGPLLALGGWGLWRRRAWGHRLAGTLWGVGAVALVLTVFLAPLALLNLLMLRAHGRAPVREWVAPAAAPPQ